MNIRTLMLTETPPMMEIELTQGEVALIDREDFRLVRPYQWYARRKTRGWYAATSARRLDGRRITLYMHRLILGLTDPEAKVDHINRNGLDNRRANLRLCSRSEIQWGRKVSANSKSGYKGVSWDKAAGKWRAQIMHYGERHRMGLFDDPAEAYAAYCEAAARLYGEFANRGT